MKEIDRIRTFNIEQMAEKLADTYASGYSKGLWEHVYVGDFKEKVAAVKEKMHNLKAVALAREVEPSESEEKGERQDTMKIKLDNNAFLPTRSFPTDAGLDLCSREERVILPRYYSYTELKTGRVKGLPMGETFDTGVHVQLPPGTYGRIEGRSGLNIKNDIVVCGGTIDQSYTGSIKVKLYNLGSEPYVVHVGDRIAQLVIVNCLHPDLEVVDELEETDRGDNGIGSTGT